MDIGENGRGINNIKISKPNCNENCCTKIMGKFSEVQNFDNYHGRERIDDIIHCYPYTTSFSIKEFHFQTC